MAAEISIGIDLDPEVVDRWRSTDCNFEVQCADALDFLQSRPLDADTLVYCDPPYPIETRKSVRPYRYEYSTKDHRALLECLRSVSCKVMISSYPSALYDQLLKGWNVTSFQGTSHTGRRTEVLSMNFEPGLVADWENT